MSKAEPIKQTPIRIPDDLRVWLKHKCVDNRRTLTAEVVARLQQTRNQEENTLAKN